MIKKINIFIVLFILFGCSSRQTLNIENTIHFRNEIEVKLDSFLIPPVLLKERKISTNNHYLISLNVDSDTLFRLFNLKTHKYVGNFGVPGRGPDDFYNVNISGFKGINNGCIVSDMRYIIIIEFANERTDNKIKFNKRIPIPGQLLPFNQTLIVSDSMICGVFANDSKKELKCFNPKTKKINDFIDFPKSNIRAPKNLLPLIFYKRAAISNVQKKIVFVYQKFPLIRIFNYSGDILSEMIVNEGPQQKKIIVNSNNIVNGTDLYSYYSKLAVSDNFIYALFEPSEFKKKNNDSSKYGEYINVPIDKKQLHIFDWSGNPVIKLILEDWMTVFTPTTDDRYIYFVHPNYSNKLYRYPLKGIIK